jgi:hypothetical protein
MNGVNAGNVATGWYKDPHPLIDVWAAWSPRTQAVSSVQLFSNNVTSAGTGSVSGPGVGDPYLTNGFNMLSARTTGAVNTGFQFWFGTQNPVASDAINQDYDFDVVFDLVVCPPFGTSPTIAECRFWAAIVAGTGTAGIIGTTDVMHTAFGGATPTGCWGFRANTNTDTGWVPIAYDGVTETAGAAIGSALVANTRYRLRVRKIQVDPNTGNAPAIYFSVNDGPETKFTAPVTPLAGGQQLSLSLAICTLNAGGASKSIGWNVVTAQYGANY